MKGQYDEKTFNGWKIQFFNFLLIFNDKNHSIQQINVLSLLENVWTNHYIYPSNLTLDGFQITKITHDFVECANPTRIPPKWSCSKKQWWFRNFL
jgi:hypothetical protein